jgi:hypothetical protein
MSIEDACITDRWGEADVPRLLDPRRLNKHGTPKATRSFGGAERWEFLPIVAAAGNWPAHGARDPEDRADDEHDDPECPQDRYMQQEAQKEKNHSCDNHGCLHQTSATHLALADSYPAHA